MPVLLTKNKHGLQYHWRRMIYNCIQSELLSLACEYTLHWTLDLLPHKGRNDASIITFYKHGLYCVDMQGMYTMSYTDTILMSFKWATWAVFSIPWMIHTLSSSSTWREIKYTQVYIASTYITSQSTKLIEPRDTADTIALLLSLPVTSYPFRVLHLHPAFFNKHWPINSIKTVTDLYLTSVSWIVPLRNLAVSHWGWQEAESGCSIDSRLTQPWWHDAQLRMLPV